MANNEANLLIRIKSMGGEILDRLVFTWGDLTNAVKKAADVLSAPVRAFAESEEASNQLTQSLVQQGIYTAKLRQNYDDIAKSLSEKTKFDDDSITKSQALLQASLGEIQITENLQRAVLDLAQAKGMDLNSAAAAVGRAIETGTLAMGRQSIQLGENLSKTERAARAVEILTQKFGGQAEAAGQGLGILTKLSNAFGNLVEDIGKALSPAVIAVTRELLDLVNVGRETTSFFDFIRIIADESAKVFLRLSTEVRTFAHAIGGTFTAISTAASQFASGQFAESIQTIRDANQKLNADTERSYRELNERLYEIDQARTNQKVIQLQKEQELEAAAAQAKIDKAAATNVTLNEMDAVNKEQKLATEAVFQQILNEQENAAYLAKLDSQIAAETNHVEKLRLVNEKKKFLSEKHNEAERAGLTKLQQFREMLNAQQVQDAQKVFGQIATLQQANSSALVAIGKAAAITMAIINTAQGVTLALATFPPPFGIAMGALVAAAGAVQIAKIAGANLAEGGIVRSQPGGMRATIGEGGSDEAVIPLDSPDAMERLGGFGGGVTINFMGPMMGDRAQAREFALMIDKELFGLRRNGESYAVDQRVT